MILSTEPPDKAVVIGCVYDPPDAAGRRTVLVDRQWPRGIPKGGAPFDRWLATVAPSASLRTFYAHRLGRFAEFAERYRTELASDDEGGFHDLLRMARCEPVTLLTATSDLEHSSARVLADELRRELTTLISAPLAIDSVVALDTLLDGAQGNGAIWSLDRFHGVNVNLVRLGPGEGVGEHVNAELDVVLVGVAGAGVVTVDDARRNLAPGMLTLIGRGTRRSVTALGEPFGYLSIHAERSGPTIRRNTTRTSDER